MTEELVAAADVGVDRPATPTSADSVALLSFRRGVRQSTTTGDVELLLAADVAAAVGVVAAGFVAGDEVTDKVVVVVVGLGVSEIETAVDFAELLLPMMLPSAEDLSFLYCSSCYGTKEMSLRCTDFPTSLLVLKVAINTHNNLTEVALQMTCGIFD